MLYLATLNVCAELTPGNVSAALRSTTIVALVIRFGSSVSVGSRGPGGRGCRVQNKARHILLQLRERRLVQIHHVARVVVLELDVVNAGDNPSRWLTLYSVAKNGVARS